EATAHYERFMKHQRGSQATAFPQAKLILAELQRRKAIEKFNKRPVRELPPKFSTWDRELKRNYLLDGLEDVNVRWDTGDMAAFYREPRISALVGLGEPIVPDLLEVMKKDHRLSRTIVG